MDPTTPLTEWAKLGVLTGSFAALLWFLRWLASELKASRVDFLIALDKQHNDHATEMLHLREHNERQVRGLHESIDDLGAEIRNYSNGRDKK